MSRQCDTALSVFVSLYCSLIPASTAACDTNARDNPPATLGEAPNIGRIKTGCGVGILAFGSPIWAHAICPPFTTISGLAPKNAGDQRTMSASLPTSKDPTWADMPWQIAGLMVYLATYRFTRLLSSDEESSFRDPRWRFILHAVCQVLLMTSPTRPMACESDAITEIAPMSCKISSAAIVSGRMRDSAKAMSSGLFLSKWWHTMSISKCSSMVFFVNGRVGLVELGSTWGRLQTRMMSGAWPPPAPSV
mmetsp:Transcript_22542/g.49371  ORF Transcript_22542/g.49371 Transcript_22542/m.49371 type:complete len:249 (+) Transcript_22542:264-1010(+)